MDEQLYAIPVNDAFDSDCECPVCVMYRQLEKNAIEFVMGPSYMEDDIRTETNKYGFCPDHLKKMYGMQNRLGLALMLYTHTQGIVREAEKLQRKGRTSSGGLFKKSEDSAVNAYMKRITHSCYVCNRINDTFERYIDTVFFLYRKEDKFRTKVADSKGFCSEHYGMLYDAAPHFLSGKELEEFTKLLDKLYIENLKRVCDDIEWYTEKFDYRNADAPWKNSKDAIIRTALKLEGVELND